MFLFFYKKEMTYTVGLQTTTGNVREKAIDCAGQSHSFFSLV